MTPRPVDNLDRANELLARAVVMLARRDGVSEARMRLEIGIDKEPDGWAEDSPAGGAR